MKFIYIGLGFISLALGTIGIFLPILPTVPFFMLSALLFAKSSERLHHWLINTNLYQKNLAPFKDKDGVPLKVKIRLIISLSLLFALGFSAMSALPVGRFILVIIWIAHVYLLGIRPKTKKSSTTQKNSFNHQ